MARPPRQQESDPRPFVMIDGRRWLVCPIRGQQCARVDSSLGEQWADDVLARHIEVSHKFWKG